MKKSTAKISTLVAVGGTLISAPATALELGEVQVQSNLGQPLRASVAFALAPTEALTNTCVSVQSGRMPGGVPGVGDANVSIANGVISITGKSAVREPLVSMRLNVRCPYAAQISRDYTMLIDPAGIPAPAQVRATQPAAASAPLATRSPAQAATARRSVATEPVSGGTQYQVRPGETLSEIVQRIEDRPVGLWPAVFAIFDANPDAFLDNDPNKLKAGSWLTIPEFGAGAPLSVAPAATAAAAAPDMAAAQPAVTDSTDGSVYTGTTPDQAAVPFDQATMAPEELAPPEQPATQETSPADTAEVASAPVIDIPDTELDAPVASSSSPNVATARVERAPAPESSTNWMLWLGGTGLALIALLLLFGRMVRNRFGSSPIAEAVPQDRRQPDSSRTLEVVSEMEVSVTDLDETEENLALDADLIIGSGLQDNSEVDVAQDFGFAATTQLDHELTEEMVARDEDADADGDAETDIIPPLNIEAQSILESEVLPDESAQSSGQEDDYDMSVIVDATQMPDPEDATLRDLEAIPVDTGDDTLVTGDYTVSSEVDYTVLEQDYEDELSATQALNEEIARAAQQLADDMEDEDSDASRAYITALDIKAQMPARNDEEFSDDDTDDDDTAKLPANQGA